MDLPIVADTTDNHIAYSDKKVLQVVFTPNMLKHLNGDCTALGLAVALLTELEPDQLTYPVHGSEFTVGGSVCIVEYNKKRYVEVL